MTDRYSRQVLFSAIGPAGQRKIQASTITIIGGGALGTVSAEMLARAGVGHLRLIDRDFIEASNLQRQSLFTENDAARSIAKARAAERALRAVNSAIQIRGIVDDVTFENIALLCRDSDLILDGTDNFETRFLINDYSISEGVPWIYGAALGSYGIAFAILPQSTPCLRCLFTQPPSAGAVETCDTVGVLGPIIHMVAAHQVSEALKILVGESPSHEIFQADIWKNSFRSFAAPKRPLEDCPCCAHQRFDFLKGTSKPGGTRLCGRDAIQISPVQRVQLDLGQLARRLAASGQVRANDDLLRLQVEGLEMALFVDGRAIIKGTHDVVRARSLYARYVGN